MSMFSVYVSCMAYSPAMEVHSVLEYVWTSILEYLCVCVYACSPVHTQSCLTLCIPTDGSP